MDISSMLEVQVKEVKVEPDVRENGEHSGSKAIVSVRNQASRNIVRAIPVSQEEQNYYQLTFGSDMASVRYRRLHCTACDVHIGSAPSQAHNMLEHPVLRTLLCARCHEFYGDGTFEQGDDATDMFCRWCANGGNLYCCSYCSNTFCYKCIRRNFVSRVRKKIEADEKWQCFVCNPADLYDMRAVCWALLRHIQTVTSILQNEKTMSREEIEEKMNLDESECCPRRSKRRQKRKHESNSEEEDETYIPKINGVPIIIKRNTKYRKNKPMTRYSAPNGTKQVRTVYATPSIKSRPSSLPNEKPNEPQLLFPQNEPPKIERQEAVEPSENTTVIPPASTIDSSIPTRYESSKIPSSLYHTAIINQTAASTTYIRPTMMNNSAFHQIILPPPPSSVSQMPPPIRSSSYQSSQSLRNSTNAMVSISKPAEIRSRPQLIFPKVRRSDVTLTPNIIDLDSDSDDEPKIVDQHNTILGEVGNVMTDMTDIPSDKIIPVALFSTENDNNVKTQSFVEVCPSLKKPLSSFSDIMLTHNRELDTFLGKVKENMRDFFVLSDNKTVRDNSLAAKQKIKLFHRNMREMVFELAHINDRVIREYNKWERSRKTETETSSTNQSAVMPEKNLDISLDMTCVNESDTESDCSQSEYQVMEPSDYVKSSNILKNLLLFGKNVKHCGVGDSVISTEDKTIQVYDVVSRDFEKCIGYSQLTKADYNKKVDESVLEPAEKSNENFDKHSYQEQFIFYLQHIEDCGIETEDMKGLEEDPDETLEESRKPHTSELCKNIGSLIASSEESEKSDQEGNTKSTVNFLVPDVPANATDYIIKIPEIEKKKTDSDSNDKMRGTDTQPAEETEKTALSEVKNGATTLNNDDVSSNRNISGAVNTGAAVTGSEDDCTIIDD